MDEDGEFSWELEPEERAQLEKDLQELFIEAWHQEEGILSSESFFSYLEDSYGTHWKETRRFISETFGTYKDLVRSLGIIPQKGLAPQDEAVRLFNIEDRLPMTYADMSEEGNYGLAQQGSIKFGSHMGMMEALGLWEEYMSLVRERTNDLEAEDNPVISGIKKATDVRREDKESLIEVVEDKLDKPYSEVVTKYSVD